MLAAVERWSPIFFSLRYVFSPSVLHRIMQFSVSGQKSNPMENMLLVLKASFPLSQQTDPTCPQSESCQRKHKQWKHMAGPGRTGSHFIGSLNLDWTRCNIKLHPEFSTTLFPSCVLWLTGYWMISPDSYEEVTVHMWLIPLPPIWEK